MNENGKNPALLPSGFADLLPPDAEQEAEAVSALMARFGKFGYRRVKPPLVEFEDSLFAGPGAVLAGETFRLMDPVSHRMMGIRSDITAQTARIAATRLKKAERPLRLMYANDVLRTRGTQRRVERQFCQVGCEMIGREADEADTEICVMALAGLKELGIKNITLDITLPRLAERIFEEHNIGEEDRTAIKAALSDRDTGRLRGLDNKLLENILQGLLTAAGPAEKALKAMAGLKLPEKARLDLEKLGTVYQGIERACRELGFEDVSVTIDPVENAGYDYEQGIAFALFTPGVHGELGRGGRYAIQFGTQEAESATGFTLYMDTVRRAMAPPREENRIFVPAGESWSLIRKLQGEGWTVLRGTGQNKSRAQCTHEYRDGKIQEIG